MIVRNKNNNEMRKVKIEKEIEKKGDRKRQIKTK
jgi:hypothetical protein